MKWFSCRMVGWIAKKVEKTVGWGMQALQRCMLVRDGVIICNANVNISFDIWLVWWHDFQFVFVVDLEKDLSFFVIVLLVFVEPTRFQDGCMFVITWITCCVYLTSVSDGCILCDHYWNFRVSWDTTSEMPLNKTWKSLRRGGKHVLDFIVVEYRNPLVLIKHKQTSYRTQN